MRRVVIVGAGPAGTRCAESLAAAGDAIAITLIGSEPHPPYNRVALSQYLVGDLEEADLVTHPAPVLAAQGVGWLPGARVCAIDRARRVVEQVDGPPLAYDALVLATGAQPIRLPIPGADGPGVIAYRTLDDVRAMLAHAGTGGSAVVIGGGLLGLEAAAGLARRGASVTVLQAAGWLMNRQLDRTAAGLLQQRLEAQGIAVITHATTTAIEPGAVLLSDGRRIPGGIVVMAAGIRPDTALAAAAGLAVGRGILVDDAMRTDDPAVWAIGECAEHDGTLIGLVAPALAQADIAAASILGGVGRYAAVSGSTALKVAGAGVWSAGDIDDGEVIILQDPAAGQYRRLVIRGDRLVGAMLYGETADAIWYMGLIKQCQPLGDIRGILPFGPAYARMETAA